MMASLLKPCWRHSRSGRLYLEQVGAAGRQGPGGCTLALLPSRTWRASTMPIVVSTRYPRVQSLMSLSKSALNRRSAVHVFGTKEKFLKVGSKKAATPQKVCQTSVLHKSETVRRRPQETGNVTMRNSDNELKLKPEIKNQPHKTQNVSYWNLSHRICGSVVYCSTSINSSCRIVTAAAAPTCCELAAKEIGSIRNLEPDIAAKRQRVRSEPTNDLKPRRSV